MLNYSEVPYLFRVFLLDKRELWDTLGYFLDSRFRGNDTPHLADLSVARSFDGQGRGELLHSAKMLL